MGEIIVRFRTYSDKEIRQIMHKNNYKPVRQKGSHVIYENDEGNHITIRVNKCNKMVFRRMIKENNLKV